MQEERKKVKSIKKSNKVSELLKEKVNKKSKKEIYRLYVSSLALIDYHLQTIIEEMKKDQEFEPWEYDIQMYKNKYETIREEIKEELLKNLKLTKEVKELIETPDTLSKINELEIKDLRKKETLDFCIEYKKGYKQGLKTSPKKVLEIYNSNKPKKQRKK